MTDTVARDAPRAPPAAPSPNAGPDPYPGPRPFLPEEDGLFFGRDRERSQLRSLVLANSMVLFYAESGAGKTSLIHAGLVPALTARHVTVFGVMRIRPAGEEDPNSRVENPYVRSMVANWAAAAGAGTPDVTNLKEFLSLLAQRCQAPADEPRVMIIDQFEELFTHFPEHWDRRGDFFAQIREALEADPDLRVLLSMREDYISQTDPYASLVPNHFQQRFRLETLRREQALEAVTGPLRATGRSFAPGAAEYLVDELLQILVERNGQLTRVTGEFVEPVQLQVVCQRLWAELPDEVTEITVSAVQASGDVDEVLANFYGDVVHDAAAQDRRARERRIRDWTERKLITSLGTRGTAHRDAAVEAGVPKPALDEMVNRHLLRAEWRNGSDWYELTHDRLIGPIQRSNAAFREAVLRRRIKRAVLTALPVLLIAGGVIASLLLPQSQAPTTAASASATTPPAPLISVPAKNGLYQQGAVVNASYVCGSYGGGEVTSCTGAVASGQPIDTRSPGRHQFSVTASYGRTGVATAFSLSYFVVGFATARYTGHAFAVSYPAAWHLLDAETHRGNYTDTTIAGPGGSGELRVDVTPGRHPLSRSANAEIAAVSREPHYRLISLVNVPLAGTTALDWQFTVQQGNTILRKDDEFFNAVNHSESFAVLTEAPAGRWRSLEALLVELRQSLVLR